MCLVKESVCFLNSQISWVQMWHFELKVAQEGRWFLLESVTVSKCHLFTTSGIIFELKGKSVAVVTVDTTSFLLSVVFSNQFSGISADRMKKVYGKFCSRHNEAVNLYKDLHAKDKRFQAFIKVSTHLTVAPLCFFNMLASHIFLL